MVYRFSFLCFQWEAETNNTLSGRILSLVVTCNYTAADRPPFSGCLLFKAVGDVTCEYSVVFSDSDMACSTDLINIKVPMK